MQVLGAWIEATRGSKRHRFLHTALRYSGPAFVVLFLGFYLFFFEMMPDDDFCLVTLMVAAVLEAAAVIMAWRKCSR